MDIIPSDLNTYGGEAKGLLEDLQSRNERMFLVTVVFLNTAKNKQELENVVFQTAGIAQKYNCALKKTGLSAGTGPYEQFATWKKLDSDQAGIDYHIDSYFCPIYNAGTVYGRRIYLLWVKCPV